MVVKNAVIHLDFSKAFNEALHDMLIRKPVDCMVCQLSGYIIGSDTAFNQCFSIVAPQIGEHIKWSIIRFGPEPPILYYFNRIIELNGPCFRPLIYSMIALVKLL